MATHSETNFIAEFLEARAYLSTVVFPTNPPEYENGTAIGSVSFSYPAVADFNGDGLADIATAIESVSGQDGSVSVELNKGNGTFGPPTILPAGERPDQVIAGVFTSSGYEDLVVANGQDGTVGFYAGEGNGMFAAPIISRYGTQGAGGTADVTDMVAADLNGDGKLDLIISDEDDDQLVTMLGNGAGSFTVKQTIPCPTGSFGNVVAGNFLDDGHIDIAAAPGVSPIIDVFAGNGDGTFSTTPVQLSTSDQNLESDGVGLVTADFTGDGRDDLALVTQSSDFSTEVLSVFLNQGNGSFSAPVGTTLPNLYDVSVGDFDGDGIPDIVTGGATGDGAGFAVYLGNGDGSFQTTAAFSLDNIGFNSGFTVADLNGDGKPDIVGVTGAAGKFPSDSAIVVYLNGQSGGGGGGGGGGAGSAALTPTIAGKLPSAVIAGQKAAVSETITITDSGAAYDASQTTQLFLSTGTTIDGNSIALPAKLTKTEKLKVGARTSFKLSLKSLPASVPDGTYHVLAQVTDNQGNTTVAASIGTITVAPPQIDLSVSLAKFTASATGGKKFAESIKVANAGNIFAKGSLPIVVDTSPDGSLADATQLAAASKSINIGPGKSTTIALSLLAPAAAASDFLIFQIDPDNKFNDVNLANNIVVSPSAVTFS
jgi:hypothetical protein